MAGLNPRRLTPASDSWRCGPGLVACLVLEMVPDSQLCSAHFENYVETPDPVSTFHCSGQLYRLWPTFVGCSSSDNSFFRATLVPFILSGLPQLPRAGRGEAALCHQLPGDSCQASGWRNCLWVIRCRWASCAVPAGAVQEGSAPSVYLLPLGLGQKMLGQIVFS